jgi:D-alanyl-D-alanine carboxypeptidase
MLRNTNQTMRENWFCTGMKTGYTDKAKHCLVSSGSYNGKEVIMVILGSSKERIFNDSAHMLRWALGLPQEGKSTKALAGRKHTSQQNSGDQVRPKVKKHHRHHSHSNQTTL